MSDIESMIAALEDMSSSDLRARWRVLTRTPVPRVSPKLLRLALAWEIQAGKLGGHSRETTRFLDQRARGATRADAARPGMRLVREWRGRTHGPILNAPRVRAVGRIASCPWSSTVARNISVASFATAFRRYSPTWTRARSRVSPARIRISSASLRLIRCVGINDRCLGD